MSYYKKLIILTITCLLFSGILKAQYIITDVTDTTLTKSSDQSGSQSYAFDVDQDGTKDFSIGVQSFVVIPTGCSMTPPTQTDLSCWIGTMPAFTNQIALSNGYTALVALDSIIDANSHSWSPSSQNFLFNKVNMFTSCIWDSIFEGNWQGDTTAFVGLKFKAGPDIHYGYVHVRFAYGMDSLSNSYVSVTILDFAYNSIPDEEIIAGGNVVNSIPENFSADDNAVKIIYDNKRNELEIDNKLFAELTLLIYNSSGQLVSSTRFRQQNYLMDFNKFQNGQYIYKVVGESYSKTGNLLKY